MIPRRVSEHKRRRATYNELVLTGDICLHQPSCSIGLSAASIESAATALRSHPALLPALKLRFVYVETAITDLETNNISVLRNLRDIARDSY